MDANCPLNVDAVKQCQDAPLILAPKYLPCEHLKEGVEIDIVLGESKF